MWSWPPFWPFVSADVEAIMADYAVVFLDVDCPDML